MAKTSKKQTRPAMWYNVKGEMTLWGNKMKYKGKDGKKRTFLSYSTSIGKKNLDDEWTNTFYRVDFPKESNPQLEGKFKININAGFITFDEWNDKHYPKVVVTDFDVLESEDEDEIEEDELPD